MTALAFALALALQADSITVPIETTQPAIRVPANTLIIPHEIAPAIRPYLDCLYASRGIAVRRQAGEPATVVVPLGADCTAHRVRAAHHADRLLRNRGHGTTGERRAYVEAVLANVDRSARGASAPAVRPRGEAVLDKPTAAEGETAGFAPSPPGRPLPVSGAEVPDPIAPALLRYTACLNGRLNASAPITDRANAAATVDAAIRACADIRATSIIEANDALRPTSGDRDPARRAQLVTRVFDDVDRQQHELLRALLDTVAREPRR